MSQEPKQNNLETELEDLKSNRIPPHEKEEIVSVPSEKPKKGKSTSDEVRKNIMFEEKEISCFRLYFHLSYKLEMLFMFLGLIGALGSGVIMPLMALVTGDTISIFADNENGEMPNDDEFRKEFKKLVNKFMFIGVGGFCAYFLNNFMWEYSGLRQMHHLKEKYFAVILKQEQGWFDQNNAYEFATKVLAQLEQIEMGVGEKFGQVIEMVSQFIAGIVIAMCTSWELTLIMLTLSPCIVLCLIFLVTSLKKAIILSRKTYEKAGGMAEEVLYNIKTVVSFSNYSFEIDRFNLYIDEIHELNKEKAWKLGVSVAGIIFFMYCTFAVAVFYSRRLMLNHKVNSNTGEQYKAGDVMTVNFAAVLAVMSIGLIAPNIKTIQESCIAASDYFTLYERKPQIDETSSVLKPPRDEVKGRIEFKNITFIYPSDEKKKKVLDGLNLVCEPGKKVALVGESGCGKSTTVNLIERLYEPVSGEVLIDGINVKDYDLKYLRTLIGYVQQEPVLFNTSIKENLIFGRQEIIDEYFGGDSDKLIKSACEEAYAKEFIEKNPDKYNYVVGIKGMKLSGGQKQRVAIARAILCKPKILILDEATSALDNKAEKEVQRALDNIGTANVTTVIIAHRLSTIKNADVIYAIKDGKVYEQGTHQELLDKNGYYAGLVRSQLAQDELESKEENFDKIAAMEKKRKSSLSKLSQMERGNSRSFHEANPKEISPSSSKKKVEIERTRLIRLLKNNKMDVFLGTMGAFLTGAIHPVVGFIQSKSIIALAGLSSKEKLESAKKDTLLFAGMYLVVALINGIVMFLKIWKFETVGSILSCSMRRIVIQKYLRLHIGFYDEDDNAPGGLLSKLSLDTTQMNSLVLTIFGDLCQTIGVLVVGLSFCFSYDWRLTLMALCFLPIIITSHVYINKCKQGGRDSYRKINIEAGSVLSECVVNTKSIFSFNFQKKAIEMYITILDAAKKDYLRDSTIKGFLMAIGIFAMFCFKAVLFHYSGEYIIDKSLSFDDMNVVIGVAIMLSKGTSDGLRGIGNLQKASIAFHSLFSTLDIKEEIDVTEEGNKNKISAENLKGRIEFKNVSFAYPTKPNNMILKNVSFVIEPGQAAALVGFSGCGKSTIIQLLERFYDVPEGQGEVLIDGINIKDYNINELRKRIGLVQQEPVLFKRSVYDNILYGRLDAKREEVFEAAKRAAIEKFFNKKELGTKEDPVSGGEKQRLAIARAFLKNPVILLLDEATSALDKESEIEVQKSLYELQNGRTSVSVAHRLSTIVDSDVIFVLENGRIVEKGRHEELLKLGGKYSTLYKYSNSS